MILIFTFTRFTQLTDSTQLSLRQMHHHWVTETNADHVSSDDEAGNDKLDTVELVCCATGSKAAGLVPTDTGGKLGSESSSSDGHVGAAGVRLSLSFRAFNASCLQQ